MTEHCETVNYPNNMLIDLHNHTSKYSDDSLLSPEHLIEVAKKAGLDGIAVTEHDFFWDYDELVDIGKSMDFLVIPGVEINTDEGHLLVFGLDHYVFGMHKTWFLKDLVDKSGGAMLAAHPYRRRFRPEFKNAEEYERMLQKASTNSMLAIVEGAEVNNGRGSEQENAFATELCRRLNLKGSGDERFTPDPRHCEERYAVRAPDLGSGRPDHRVEGREVSTRAATVRVERCSSRPGMARRGWAYFLG